MRYALLVELVVVEGAVVGDDEQARDAIVRGGPQRRDPHQEIAVAENPRHHPAAVLERERSPHDHARARADATAAVAAKVVERVLEVAIGAVPSQGQACQANVQPGGRCVEPVRQRAQGKCFIGRCFLGPLLLRRRGARLHGLQQKRNDRVRLAHQVNVGRRQALVVHAPAAMRMRIGRDENHLGPDRRVAPRLLQRAGGVDPVQRQHHVGFTQRISGILVQERRRRRGVQRMIGRKRGARFKVGQDACLQPFRERDAGFPACPGARDAAGEDHRVLRRRKKLRRSLDQFGLGQNRFRRAITAHLGQRRERPDLRLLQRGVEIDVRRPARRGVGNLRGAQQRLVGGGHRRRLVVPLGVVAHQCALVR